MISLKADDDAAINQQITNLDRKLSSDLGEQIGNLENKLQDLHVLHSCLVNKSMPLTTR